MPRWRRCETGPSAEAHAAALAFVHELAELEVGGFWRRRGRRLPDPARAIEAALADFGPHETAGV